VRLTHTKILRLFRALIGRSSPDSRDTDGRTPRAARSFPSWRSRTPGCPVACPSKAWSREVSHLRGTRSPPAGPATFIPSANAVCGENPSERHFLHDLLRARSSWVSSHSAARPPWAWVSDRRMRHALRRPASVDPSAFSVLRSRRRHFLRWSRERPDPSGGMHVRVFDTTIVRGTRATTCRSY